MLLSYILHLNIQAGKCLKERGTLKLNIERNLYEDFCRDGKRERKRKTE